MYLLGCCNLPILLFNTSLQNILLQILHFSYNCYLFCLLLLNSLLLTLTFFLFFFIFYFFIYLFYFKYFFTVYSFFSILFFFPQKPFFSAYLFIYFIIIFLSTQPFLFFSLPSLLQENLAFCPYWAKYLAICPSFQTIQGRASVSILDYTKIELLKVLDYAKAELQPSFYHTGNPAWLLSNKIFPCYCF